MFLILGFEVGVGRDRIFRSYLSGNVACPNGVVVLEKLSFGIFNFERKWNEILSSYRRNDSLSFA